MTATLFWLGAFIGMVFGVTVGYAIACVMVSGSTAASLGLKSDPPEAK